MLHTNTQGDWPFSSGKEIKVSKGAKIMNRYNHVPHLTQNTNGKVTNSQLDTTNESQAVSPFPAGDHKAHVNRHSQRHSKHKTGKAKIISLRYSKVLSIKYLCKFSKTPWNRSQVRKQTKSFAESNANANDNVIHTKKICTTDPIGGKKGA